MRIRFTKLPRFIQIALAALMLAIVPLTAFALIGPKNVDGQLRVARYVIPRVSIGAAADVTVDTEGVIVSQTIWDGAAVIAAPSIVAPNVGTMPYPAKLRVDLVDGGAASGAITCTSVVIRGKDQFGRAINETVSTLTETEQITARVYEQVDYVTFAGCAIASGGDTDDLIQVSASYWIGLPRKLRTAADIISMCFSDTSASAVNICYRGAGTVASTPVSLDEAGAIDLDDSAVNITDAQLTTVLVDGDLGLTFVLRATDPPAL